VTAIGADNAPPLRWWGWGEREVSPPEGLLALLRDEIDAADGVIRRAPRLDDVALPPAQLPSELRRRLVDAVGGFQVRDDAEERIRHAAGRSYLDLLHLRSGRLLEAPDAVVHAGDAAEIGAVLRQCSQAGCSVVPFGGGTSVVGGVAPRHDDARPLITLDLDRLDAVRDVDRTSMTATLEAGMRGPRIEAELTRRGLTLGHFPQSFEYATAGGFAATRSAGQASSGYGRFDEMLVGLRMQSPASELLVRAQPSAATGPALLQVVAGSEGTLGVISEVTVRVRPRPAVRHYAAWSLQTIDAGLALLRELAQQRAAPDVARLADAEETRVSLSMTHGRAAAMARRYLSVRGHRTPCLLILGWEGEAGAVGARVRAAATALRRAGAITLGEAPARAWLRDRFQGPYLRDALLDRGFLVETLETAAAWSQLQHVRDAVIATLRTSLTASGTPPLIGSHISHLYADGASLYFTVLARQLEGDEEGQWVRAKHAATDAIVSAGAALSHHHGVGADHVQWMGKAHGESGVAVIREVKRELDPAGIMNPCKLIPCDKGL
jgi:alkyldihydroxyacetonephosphate synthase